MFGNGPIISCVVKFNGEGVNAVILGFGNGVLQSTELCSKFGATSSLCYSISGLPQISIIKYDIASSNITSIPRLSEVKAPIWFMPHRAIILRNFWTFVTPASSTMHMSYSLHLCFSKTCGKLNTNKLTLGAMKVVVRTKLIGSGFRRFSSNQFSPAKFLATPHKESLDKYAFATWNKWYMVLYETKENAFWGLLSHWQLALKILRQLVSKPNKITLNVYKFVGTVKVTQISSLCLILSCLTQFLTKFI